MSDPTAATNFDSPREPLRASPAAGSPTADVKPASRPRHAEPQHIGPYRILETIGEGGMGVVYKAEQREPVRRIVALKVIKLGMDTREVVARFEAERQALAMLSHPNVANSTVRFWNVATGREMLVFFDAYNQLARLPFLSPGGQLVVWRDFAHDLRVRVESIPTMAEIERARSAQNRAP